MAKCSYQSTRRAAYREALAALTAAGRIFRCSCSRKDLAASTTSRAGYPGHLPRTDRREADRPRCASASSDRAYPLRRPVPGRAALRPGHLRRRGRRAPRRLASYQLAVVVDDAFQEVTRVVRGADLLASTPWQIDLQEALSLPRPIYGHLPLLLEPDGAKLSKSRRCGCRSTRRRHPRPSFRPLRICRRPHPPNWPTLLLKRCGNGRWRTGTRKRLRARRRSRCPPAGDSEAESNGKNCGVQRGVLRYSPTRRVKA